VRRGRNLSEQQGRGAQLSWRSIPASDVVDGWVTAPVRTVVDCAALLPFDEALAVADSALRARTVSRSQLRTAALKLSPHGGRRRVLAVVEAADPLAANPFESVLRAICHDVPAVSVVPQHRIHREGRFLARVDLADLRLRIVLEADSYEFHGERELFEKDVVRYDELSLEGWLVLRFAWMHVMHRPAWVRSVIERAVAERQELLALRSRVAELESQLALVG
jgi:very-short-patch-repair endonuclease